MSTFSAWSKKVDSFILDTWSVTGMHYMFDQTHRNFESSGLFGWRAWEPLHESHWPTTFKLYCTCKSQQQDIPWLWVCTMGFTERRQNQVIDGFGQYLHVWAWIQRFRWARRVCWVLPCYYSWCRQIHRAQFICLLLVCEEGACDLYLKPWQVSRVPCMCL